MLFEHLALNSCLLTAVMIATGRGGWPLLLTFLLMSGTKLVVLDFQMPPSEPKTFKKDPPEKMGIHTGKIGIHGGFRSFSAQYMAVFFGGFLLCFRLYLLNLQML
jgi:hypothetical protein